MTSKAKEWIKNHEKGVAIATIGSAVAVGFCAGGLLTRNFKSPYSFRICSNKKEYITALRELFSWNRDVKSEEGLVLIKASAESIHEALDYLVKNNPNECEYGVLIEQFKKQ